jgi:imidazoleglycerol phosphate dehydratase HisB/histidinol-phosphate/aromatic aminotransferase/cobyric acid decarboxylase-like protein
MTTPIRPDLADAQPYRWQEGIPTEGRVLRFDMNTQPHPLPWYAGIADRLASVPVEIYPDATYGRLRRLLASYTGFPPEQIIPTAGADEALVIAALLVLRPGDRAFARHPYYGWYENATRLAGGELTDDPDGAALHWICTPHNPTGVDEPEQALAERGGLVVVDQAYAEFGGTDVSHLVSERDNVLVVRTMSKAFAMAGARVGYILSPPGLCKQLDAIRLAAGISAHSARLAEIALEELDEMRASVALTCAERDRVTAALRAAGFDVPESRTNFVFCGLGEPNTAMVERLLDAGMVVRTYDDLPDRIRITLSTPDENDELLAVVTGAAPARPSPPLDGRAALVERRTRETAVSCRVALDGGGVARVTTGIGFLDHMLTALAFHSLCDLDLACTGDLWVDEHHTVEDVALTLGDTLDRALGDRAGITRFGDARAPLDEALCHATVDMGGRGVAAVRLPFSGDRVGGLPTSLVPHFFDSLARAGRLGIHLEGAGADDHHLLEAAFKSLALALRQAWTADGRRSGAPSTKGTV